MRPVIVSVGELLWDRFPTGDRLGGAPANVACHCASLGADAYVITAVGDDDLGHRAIAQLREKGVHTDHVAVLPDVATGTVDIAMDDHRGHSFTINSPAAWDHLEATDTAKTLVGDADALVFGTLGQRTDAARHATQKIIAAASEKTLRLCDANFRAPFDDHDLLRQLLPMADILKINDEELAEFAAGTTAADFFADQPQLQNLVYTRGAAGALLLGRDSQAEHLGMPTDVVDTVGAGDSFTATVLMGMLRGKPLKEIIDRAVQIAAFVCTQSGATPELPDHLRRW